MLKYYVLRYDFNKRSLVSYNIFDNYKFKLRVKELLDSYDGDKEKFKIELEKILKYCFWSKREYELSIGDAFEMDIEKYEKIDIYYQIKDNLDILSEYILNNY